MWNVDVEEETRRGDNKTKTPLRVQEAPRSVACGRLQGEGRRDREWRPGAHIHMDAGEWARHPRPRPHTYFEHWHGLRGSAEVARLERHDLARLHQLLAHEERVPIEDLAVPLADPTWGLLHRYLLLVTSD